MSLWTRTESKVQLRVFRSDDIDELVRIEDAVFKAPDRWDYNKMAEVVTRTGQQTVIAERAGNGKPVVIGFSICQTLCDSVMLHDLAVDPKYHRQGVGSRLIEDILKRLQFDIHGLTTNVGILSAYAAVSEYNLTAQLFLAHRKFRCVSQNGMRGNQRYTFKYEVES